MKNKIIKLLAQPQIILPIAFGAALLIGVGAYFTVGQVPKISTINSDSDANLAGAFAYKNGEELSLAFPKSGRVNKIYVKIDDHVAKGELLAALDSSDAQGALNQAAGNLESARANYEKVLNGATNDDINIAQSAVTTAQVNLDQTKLQQAQLVDNAKRNLLNSGFTAVIDSSGEYAELGRVSNQIPPTISGTYTKNTEGQIKIKTYNSAGGISYEVSGLVYGNGIVNTVIPQALGDSGLYIKFSGFVQPMTWVVNIPNKESPTYVQNYNAYQAALAAQAQTIASAQALLAQAKTTLIAKQANARPEDVSAAKAQVDAAVGAYEIAFANYNNDLIKAPADGMITSVNIGEGEMAIMNQKAIGMVVQSAKQ